MQKEIKKLLEENPQAKIKPFLKNNSDTLRVERCNPYIGEDGDIYLHKYIELSGEESVKHRKSHERRVRNKRDSLLANTDWRFRSDQNPSHEWIDYCQALRDITNQEEFPYSVKWPVKPRS